MDVGNLSSIPVFGTGTGQVSGPARSNFNQPHDYASPIQGHYGHPATSQAAAQFQDRMNGALGHFLDMNQGYSTYITQLSTHALAVSMHTSDMRVSSAAAHLAKGLLQLAP